MVDFFDENPERYELILKALRGYNLDITPSGTLEQMREAEAFWRNLWDQVPSSSNDEQVQWIREQIPKYFRAIKEQPRWIQNPDWPFAGGKPMTFLGQIDVARTPDNLAGKFFHDDVSYFVFIPSYDLIEDDGHYPERVIVQSW